MLKLSLMYRQFAQSIAYDQQVLQWCFFKFWSGTALRRNYIDC